MIIKAARREKNKIVGQKKNRNCLQKGKPQLNIKIGIFRENKKASKNLVIKKKRIKESAGSSLFK